MKVPLLLGRIGHYREYPRFLIFSFSRLHIARRKTVQVKILAFFLSNLSLHPLTRLRAFRLFHILEYPDWGLSYVYRLYWYSKNYTLRIVRRKKSA